MSIVIDETFCVNHPNRSTFMRCNRCGNPVCTRCAERTPVGYRCTQCVRLLQRAHENVRWFEYGLIGLLAALISGVLALLLFSPVFCGAILLSPMAGVILAEIEWRITLQRLGAYIRWVVAGGLVLGGLFAASVTAVGGIGLFVAKTTRDLGVLILPAIPLLQTALCGAGYWLWSKWRRR